MTYLWTDQATIQSYLDGEGSIQIRDDDIGQADDFVKNFPMSTAMRLENEAVYEIATLLSMVFTGDAGVYSSTPLGFNSGTCPQYLSLLAAKLAASKVATVRLGESLSTLPNWVRVYKNEVYAQLQRWVTNAETASIDGLTLRVDYDLADVLLKMKIREHTAEDLEN